MMSQRLIYRSGLLATAFAAVCLVSLEANAFWGSRGSGGSYGSAGSYGSGGSYASAGSYGSRGSFGSRGSRGSGGSYASAGSYGSVGSHGSYASAGSYGSHGGGFLQRHKARKAARRAARASYGSYGSAGSHGSYSYSSAGSHGSYGGHSSHGSYGGHVVTPSYSSAGSHGGSHGGAVIYGHASTTVAKPIVLASKDATGELQVNVPADAVVYVNDHKTTSTGASRNYVSKGLKQGAAYKYRVRVEYQVAGKTVTETKTATVLGGGSASLEFGAEQPAVAAKPKAETKLTLSVPADAKVTLAGSATGQEGAEREYVTTKLPEGAAWDNYVVRVETGAGVQERTITLVGGESQHLVFDFAEIGQLAAR